MPYSGAMTRRTPRRRGRRRPAKKPLDKFLDSLAGMLETVAATAVFSGGAVLLGRMLGTPPPPLELPPGLPPEIKAEWERLMGTKRQMRIDYAGKPTKGKEGAVIEGPNKPPRPEPVKLLKGTDGVYRPQD